MGSCAAWPPTITTPWLRASDVQTFGTAPSHGPTHETAGYRACGLHALAHPVPESGSNCRQSVRSPERPLIPFCTL